MEQRNTLLSLKKEEVDRVFEAVSKRLKHMAKHQPDRFGRLLWTLFEAGRAHLPGGPLRVTVGGADHASIEQIEHQTEVTLAHEQGWMGLIVETADGKVRCDYSFDVLLDQYRAERQWIIEDRLFKTESQT